MKLPDKAVRLEADLRDLSAPPDERDPVGGRAVTGHPFHPVSAVRRRRPTLPAVLAMLALTAMVAACSGSAGPPTTRPTLRLAPTAAGGSDVVPGPSGSGPAAPQGSGVSPVHASLGPSEVPAGPSDASASPLSGSAGPVATDVAFPNPVEVMLLGHTTAAIRPTCDRSDPFYPTERDSISCGGDTLPFVDYTLFRSVDDMQAAYTNDVQQSGSPAVAGGTCARANYEDGYRIDGVAVGRLQCTTRESGGVQYKVIEWTRDRLDILAYLWSATATWPQMIEFWRTQAGPVE